MKIVCISDTHEHHERIAVPEGDVLVHAGDFTWTGSEGSIKEFNEWLGTLPHKYKIIIAGNHDWLFQREPERARALITNAHYLEDSEVTIEGVKFYGSPWQPEFHNWAFNLPRGSKDLADKWAAIPEDTDVLITHGPAAEILDYTSRGMRVGCSALRYRVEQLKPKLHIFGHVHEGYGLLHSIHTKYVNASICTSDYAPTNEPIVMELLGDRAFRVTQLDE